MRQIFICILALFVGLTALPNAEDSLNQPVRLTGRIMSAGEPVVAATVILMLGDSIITRTPTGADGQFELVSRVDYDKSYVLSVSSVGFETARVPVTAGPLTRLPDILLRQQPLEVGSVTVLGSHENPDIKESIERREIVLRAGQSFVPTNPIAAIKRPEIVRQGSVHSSQIRVDGAAPEFQIGGASVGTDPDHYGMFAVLPTPAVGSIDLQSRGTSARQSAPSVVELTPPKAYDRSLSGEINLSFIEATGAIAYGTENHYALATVRKSVLDQLVNSIDIRAGRRTIPPAGFTDLFLSVGRKFDNEGEIVVNQYHSADRLDYNTGPTRVSPNGVSTFQDTEEHFVSARYKGLSGDLLFNVKGNVHLRDENYTAHSQSQPGALDIDLKEQSSELGAAVDVTYDWHGHAIEAGIQTQAVVGRHTSLAQKNWNFLPPDATSDSPHPYQSELNASFGEVVHNLSNMRNAVYVSIGHEYGSVRFENGVRLQTFSGLARSTDIVQRHRITYQPTPDTRVGLFLGNFSESPISRLLEPYQVLVRADNEQLVPVHTRLISVNAVHKSFSVEGFVRRSYNLPVLEPTFSTMYLIGPSRWTGGTPLLLAAPPELSMRPHGDATTYGVEFALSTVSLFDPGLRLTASYALTHTRFETPFGGYPTDLDAPHRFFAHLEFTASPRLTLGSDVAVRTGYPYTPYGQQLDTETRYSTAYYSSQVAAFNSGRFPVNYQVNLSATYDFGRSQLFFTVANLSNRGNPIINTNNGYVYDAGILPSIGYRLTF